ncbi:MAG: TRZ/ATZ family hydrolase [Zoogloeaceae bacterium]|nr:TRZ/ATZ family hydrolase [Zoogloeaceae bacterium]
MPVSPVLKTAPQHEIFILYPRWLADVSHCQTLEDHALFIERGRIRDLLPAPLARQKYADLPAIELPKHLLIPGLVNLHAHAAMSLLRGFADDLPLKVWLEERIWPAEGKLVSRDFIYDGTLLACAEMLQSGITTFNDMYFFPDDAARAALDIGMRLAAGVCAFDFPTPSGPNWAEDLKNGEAAMAAAGRHSRLSWCVAPHAPYSVGDEGLAACRDFSQKHGIPVHIHVQETAGEVTEHLARYGCRPTERLWRLGLVDARLIAVHAVHTNAEDIETLARGGASMAHCPASNLKLASGIAPLNQWLEAGLNVGLGTDGAASNNRLDLLSEMRLAALLAKGVSGRADAAPAWAILRMATLGGAKALGLDHETGSLDVGKAADMVALDLSVMKLQPVYDPVSHLLYCAEREQVEAVWVEGRCCVFGKSLTPRVHSCLGKLDGRLALWQNAAGSSLRTDRDGSF